MRRSNEEASQNSSPRYLGGANNRFDIPNNWEDAKRTYVSQYMHSCYFPYFTCSSCSIDDLNSQVEFLRGELLNSHQEQSYRINQVYKLSCLVVILIL